MIEPQLTRTQAWTLVAAIVLLIALFPLAARTPTPEPSALSLEPARTLTVRDGYDPIVTWDPNDKRLTIHLDHVAANVLICIGQTCNLGQEWVAPR